MTLKKVAGDEQMRRLQYPLPFYLTCDPFVASDVLKLRFEGCTKREGHRLRIMMTCDNKIQQKTLMIRLFTESVE